MFRHGRRKRSRAPDRHTRAELLHFGVLTPRRANPLGTLPNILAEAKRTVESWGGEMILVYLPAYSRFHMWFGPGTAGYREVLRTADSLGLPLVDMYTVFKQLPDPKRMWTDPAGHLNAEGYGRVSRSIEPAVERILREQSPRPVPGR